MTLYYDKSGDTLYKNVHKKLTVFVLRDSAPKTSCGGFVGLKI